MSTFVPKIRTVTVPYSVLKIFKTLWECIFYFNFEFYWRPLSIQKYQHFFSFGHKTGFHILDALNSRCSGPLKKSTAGLGMIGSDTCLAVTSRWRSFCVYLFSGVDVSPKWILYGAQSKFLILTMHGEYLWLWRLLCPIFYVPHWFEDILCTGSVWIDFTAQLSMLIATSISGHIT